jgi:septal ring factor EnvC (AmiA/AmiB activator)
LKVWRLCGLEQISYEVPYTSSEVTDKGIEDLAGISLGAATFVRMPAYTGRTPVLAVASNKNTGDNNMEETESMEELETLKQQLSEAQDEIKELKDQLAEKNETEASLSEELTELREFKVEIEKVEAEVEKLEAIEAKFTEAGIETEEEYFETNKETLLALDDTAIDFMVQELVSFAEKKGNTKEDIDDDDDIPPITGDRNAKMSNLEEMAKALEELTLKK